MTQEEKELLLRDLCARLPYGVIIKHKDEHGRSIDARLVGYNGDWFNYYIDDLCFHLKIHEFKPYLRPIHKLTKEELEELEFLTDSDYVDYCNKHHIDYRNLIPKGLALEAPEGMYNIKKK